MHLWPDLVVFVRHGESTGNVLSKNERAGLEIPTFEYPLTEKGKQQAEITGAWIRQNFEPFDVHYTSTCRRAQETFRLVFPKITPRIDSRLDEVDHGIEEVLTQEEILKLFPFEMRRRTMYGIYRYRPLGGENWSDAEHNRVRPICNRFRRKYKGKKLLMVGHGTWFTLFRKVIHHYSIDQVIREFREDHTANASVTIYRGVEVNGKPRLELVEYNLAPWKGKL